jgi:hypothetical protein
VTPREILHLYQDAVVDTLAERHRRGLVWPRLLTKEEEERLQRRWLDLRAARQEIEDALSWEETGPAVVAFIRRDAEHKDTPRRAWLHRVADDVEQRLGLTGHPLPSSDDLPEDAPAPAAPPAGPAGDAP